MERKRSKEASSYSMVLLWVTIATLLSQNLVIPVLSSSNVEDQKTYYSPGPHARTPPTGHHRPPHGSRTPSHGGSPPSNCGNPPSGSTRSYTPPSTTPSTPSIPTPSTPSTPTIVSPPTTPTIDPGTPTIVTPPTTPTIDPGTPTIVTPPTTPIIDPGTPTTPIIDPGTPTIPGISIPSPPFSIDPNSPPFTCDFWRNHPTLIWGLLGWLGTVGGAFGVTSVPGLGSSTSLLEALGNSRSDGLGALYREGTASLLNSMADNNRFPYSTRQVRERFVSGLSSNKAAAAQAHLFKLANEGRIPRAP